MGFFVVMLALVIFIAILLLFIWGIILFSHGLAGCIVFPIVNKKRHYKKFNILTGFSIAGLVVGILFMVPGILFMTTGISQSIPKSEVVTVSDDYDYFYTSNGDRYVVIPNLCSINTGDHNNGKEAFCYQADGYSYYYPIKMNNFNNIKIYSCQYRWFINEDDLDTLNDYLDNCEYTYKYYDYYKGYVTVSNDLGEVLDYYHDYSGLAASHGFSNESVSFYKCIDDKFYAKAYLLVKSEGQIYYETNDPLSGYQLTEAEAKLFEGCFSSNNNSSGEMV